MEKGKLAASCLYFIFQNCISTYLWMCVEAGSSQIQSQINWDKVYLYEKIFWMFQNLMLLPYMTKHSRGTFTIFAGFSNCKCFTIEKFSASYLDPWNIGTIQSQLSSHHTLHHTKMASTHLKNKELSVEILCGTWPTILPLFWMATAWWSLGFPSSPSQRSCSPITGVQFPWHTHRYYIISIAHFVYRPPNDPILDLRTLLSKLSD